MADIRAVTTKVSPKPILPAIFMPAYSRVIPIAAATSALAATCAGLLVMIFGLVASLEDRVREMPWTYWIMSIGLILMAPVLVVVATDRGRKPRNCDQVAGVVMVLTVLAALRPLIVAFVGLEQPATLAERAPLDRALAYQRGVRHPTRRRRWDLCKANDGRGAEFAATLRVSAFHP